jgi:hypothetical protein
MMMLSAISCRDSMAEAHGECGLGKERWRA